MSDPVTKLMLTIDDASIDAALDVWFSGKQWRENSDADLCRKLMRKSFDAAVEAAPLRGSGGSYDDGYRQGYEDRREEEWDC